MDVGLMYTAVDSGDVDVIVAFATDARIGKVGLRVLADDKLFFCNELGVTTVLKPGRAFEKIASNPLPDGIMASPVAAGRELFIRTKAALYCIAEP